MIQATKEAARATQLGYIGIGAKDLGAWREFAVQVLGMQEAADTCPDTLLLRMDEYHHRIAIFPSVEDDILFAGWQVADAAALLEISTRLGSMGIEVTPGTAAEAAERRVREMVKFHDPDGLETHVYHWPILDHVPFRSQRLAKGFRTGDCGFGHIVLDVKDVERSVNFYRDALGARVSDYIVSGHPTTSSHRALERGSYVSM